MSFQPLVLVVCGKALLETVKPLATKFQKARNFITDWVDRVKGMRVAVDHELEAWYTDRKMIEDELQIEYM